MGFNIFTYGTLMFPEIWDRVVGCKYYGIEATISGYQRKRIRNKAYPALVPGKPYDTVKGILYLDVSPEHLQVLDRFEGETYKRIEVRCKTAEGKVLPALAYLFREEYADLIEEDPWDPEWFLKQGMGSFTEHYEGLTR